MYRTDGADGSDAPVEQSFTVDVLNWNDSAIAEDKYVPVIQESLRGTYCAMVGSGGSTNVCTDIKAWTNDGDLPNSGIDLVAIDGSSNCRLFDFDLCKLLGTLTNADWADGIRLVGVDTSTNPDECHLYDLGPLVESICELAAVVQNLVDDAAIGSNDVCP